MREQEPHSEDADQRPSGLRPLHCDQRRPHPVRGNLNVVGNDVMIERFSDGCFPYRRDIQPEFVGLWLRDTHQ